MTKLMDMLVTASLDTQEVAAKHSYRVSPYQVDFCSVDFYLYLNFRLQYRQDSESAHVLSEYKTCRKLISN